MALPISDYLVDDDYAPSVPKPSLQQYDNYQIYDLYCEDISVQINSSIDGDYVRTTTELSRLAVQAYSTMPISCNFDAIVKQYL